MTETVDTEFVTVTETVATKKFVLQVLTKAREENAEHLKGLQRKMKEGDSTVELKLKREFAIAIGRWHLFERTVAIARQLDTNDRKLATELDLRLSRAVMSGDGKIKLGNAIELVRLLDDKYDTEHAITLTVQCVAAYLTLSKSEAA